MILQPAKRGNTVSGFFLYKFKCITDALTLRGTNLWFCKNKQHILRVHSHRANSLVIPENGGQETILTFLAGRKKKKNPNKPKIKIEDLQYLWPEEISQR